MWLEMQLGTGSGLSIGTGGTVLRATGPRSRAKLRAWVRDRGQAWVREGGQNVGQGQKAEHGSGTQDRRMRSALQRVGKTRSVLRLLEGGRRPT